MIRGSIRMDLNENAKEIARRILDGRVRVLDMTAFVDLAGGMQVYTMKMIAPLEIVVRGTTEEWRDVTPHPLALPEAENGALGGRNEEGREKVRG